MKEVHSSEWKHNRIVFFYGVSYVSEILLFDGFISQGIGRLMCRLLGVRLPFCRYFSTTENKTESLEPVEFVYIHGATRRICSCHRSTTSSSLFLKLPHQLFRLIRFAHQRGEIDAPLCRWSMPEQQCAMIHDHFWMRAHPMLRKKPLAGYTYASPITATPKTATLHNTAASIKHWAQLSPLILYWRGYNQCMICS